MLPAPRCLPQVPRWARMPSDLQQHWLHYTLIGAAGGYGALFLFRRARRGEGLLLPAWLPAL